MGGGGGRRGEGRLFHYEEIYFWRVGEIPARAEVHALLCGLRVLQVAVDMWL
jgi:hypothetical protein